jgi:hypothetical protein
MESFTHLNAPNVYSTARSNRRWGSLSTTSGKRCTKTALKIWLKSTSPLKTPVKPNLDSKCYLSWRRSRCVSKRLEKLCSVSACLRRTMWSSFAMVYRTGSERSLTYSRCTFTNLLPCSIRWRIDFHDLRGKFTSFSTWMNKRPCSNYFRKQSSTTLLCSLRVMKCQRKEDLRRWQPLQTNIFKPPRGKGNSTESTKRK